MICIGFYPCCLGKGLPGHDHEEARVAVIGKSDPAMEGYDTFLRAYCSKCYDRNILKKGEGLARMDDVYVEFAKRGKIPRPVTRWYEGAP